MLSLKIIYTFIFVYPLVMSLFGIIGSNLFHARRTPKTDITENIKEWPLVSILGAHAANAEYLVCVDADAYLEDRGIYFMVANFFHFGERLGTVTGNPQIRNRDTLLAKLQILEYASIVGAIKRT